MQNDCALGVDRRNAEKRVVTVQTPVRNQTVLLWEDEGFFNAGF